MVIIIKPRLGKLCCLLVIKHAESHASFKAKVFDLFDHIANTIKVPASWSVTICCSHAKTGCTTFFGIFGAEYHLFSIHEFFGFKFGLIVNTLRAIGAVFWTRASFNAKQSCCLNGICWKVCAMNLLGFEN